MKSGDMGETCELKSDPFSWLHWRNALLRLAGYTCTLYLYAHQQTVPSIATTQYLPGSPASVSWSPNPIIPLPWLRAHSFSARCSSWLRFRVCETNRIRRARWLYRHVEVSRGLGMRRGAPTSAILYNTRTSEKSTL